MQKFVLMACAAVALAFAAPRFVLAAPVIGGGGLGAAADGIVTTENAYYGYYRRHYRRYYRRAYRRHYYYGRGYY